MFRYAFGSFRRGFGTFRREFGIVRYEFGIVRCEFGIVRCEFGIVRSEFGIVRCGFGIVRCGFGIVRCGFGIVRSEFGMFRSCLDTGGSGGYLIERVGMDGDSVGNEEFVGDLGKVLSFLKVKVVGRRIPCFWYCGWGGMCVDLMTLLLWHGGLFLEDFEGLA